MGNRKDNEMADIRMNRRKRGSMAYEEYKRMEARVELLEILAEAEEDVKNGRVAPVCETFGSLRNVLQ